MTMRGCLGKGWGIGSGSCCGMDLVSLVGDMSGRGIRCSGSSSRIRRMMGGGGLGFGVSRGGYWHWVCSSQDGRMDEEFFKGDAFHRVLPEQFPY